MDTLLSKIKSKIDVKKAKKLIHRVLAAVPTRLPVGMTEFSKWAQSIIDLYDLPDNDSTRFALATMILHLGPTDARKPKRHFGLMATKGMASEIAVGVMNELKAKQKAAEAQKVADSILQKAASEVTEENKSGS